MGKDEGNHSSEGQRMKPIQDIGQRRMENIKVMVEVKEDIHAGQGVSVVNSHLPRYK